VFYLILRATEEDFSDLTNKVSGFSSYLVLQHNPRESVHRGWHTWWIGGVTTVSLLDAALDEVVGV
jgi:hypothetical protein